jgi:RimJ/RimL family protein N-acetyltransferase
MSEPAVSQFLKMVTLKNGVRVVLRPVTAADVEPLLAFFRRLPPEETALMREDVTSAAVVKRWFDGKDGPPVFSIAAEVGDRIMGDATLITSPAGWHRHVGFIRLAVDTAFRRQGLGLLMASELVSMAMQLNLDKLCAELMREQVKETAMLKRIGFGVEAELKDHIMDLSGRKHDLVLLTHFVGALWENLYDSEFYQLRLNQMED